MNEVEQYLSDEFAKITGVNVLLTDRKYIKKQKSFVYTLRDFKWIGVDNFIDILLRRFKRVFGKELDNYIKINYKTGNESRHSYDFVLYVKVLIDLDTLAGYLRLTQRERETNAY